MVNAHTQVKRKSAAKEATNLETNSADTMRYIAISRGHISLLVIGDIRMCTIGVGARRRPICQIISGIFELKSLVISIACTRQENSIVSLWASKEHTIDAVDHHIIPIAIF